MNSPLLTDLYQLTMGQAYWHHGRHRQEAIFHLFFRRAPFGEQAALFAGLETALEFLRKLAFGKKEVAYLASLVGNNDQPLFSPDYLSYLRELEWTLTIKAPPEGSLVLPHQPLLQVRGPILQAQLVETALLNFVNFQTLIATQAARVCEAAGKDPVLEFGLRRAQGPDGGLSASRAAYLGGCAGTSNVLAGYRYGIPLKGTHAHSWVMSFEDELDSFRAYADALPNNTTLLVDTYDTVAGIKKAIIVARELEARGHHFMGIRLDSGDLHALSLAARSLLDDAGFPTARIVASNDLDVATIRELKARGASIDTWGVGTRLITAAEQPALGGVYKLGALQTDKGWRETIKLSEDPVKASNPGCLNVRKDEARWTLFNEWEEEESLPTALLQPVMKEGKVLQPSPPLASLRQRALAEWAQYREQRPTLHRSPRLEARRAALLAATLPPAESTPA
ncbi:nicotinate phosphoribosyltransferase [Roseibacillus ishigakijimensis]|uniref:Nicotinate phosphoribosyltransferase n=1 Tax=Roseibacillus ishigakijimensis TaxID=454146 RepID=A0A934RV06_9BACT|nr:nicotinate phosphoribosyltransferase [Roseibacillus ishigakijimensis]MBK1835509.1 nicotinate phosphoribosyltransferase [Roseibacillus ishigakijimensis]